MKKSDPYLYLVTDRSLSGGRPLAFIVEQAVQGGVAMVQLREKNCPVPEFIRMALRLKQLLKPYRVPLIINDRLDVAMASGADGLHIGQDDIPYSYARKMLGKNKIIGLSVETIDQAEEANDFNVDYIGISPVFVTGTKPELEKGLGLDGVRAIASLSKHYTVAIGGINAANAGAVLQAGANGLAVVSAIVSADNPRKAAEVLKGTMDGFKHLKDENK